MPNFITQTSISMGVGGPLHMPTFFRSGGPSLHPLQRTGAASAKGSIAGHPWPAPIGHDMQGSAPAAWVDMVLPPVVPLQSGNPRDGRFQV